MTKGITKSGQEERGSVPKLTVEKAIVTELNAAARTRPFTGQEYIESLRDGREIWIYGERVKDVTTHPAFRNTVRMLARLYDALHDRAQEHALHGNRHRQRRLHSQILSRPRATPKIW